jgi:quinol monooxygenase YgiN
MGKFGQHTKLSARDGRREELVEKFAQAARIQAGNAACDVMFVSVAPDDETTVYLTEVWSSEKEHARARESEEIQAWAEGMQELVAGPPDSVRFEPVAGKGVG